MEAMKAGRTRWLAHLRAEGKPIPCARKKGGRNRSIEERAQAAWERPCASGGMLLVRTGANARRVEIMSGGLRPISLHVETDLGAVHFAQMTPLGRCTTLTT
jgi:hypothetical protein